MSENLENQGTPIDGETLPETSQEGTATGQTVGYYEQQALQQGWIPQDEFQGDPEKWRPAKEFVERGELFSKIEGMGRELKETKKALMMLKEHHEKIKKTEYDRAISELKAIQKKSLEEGNSESYLETSEILTDLKAEQKAREIAAEVQAKPTDVDPRFTQWLEKNKWYAKDPEMRIFADSIGEGFRRINPNENPENILKYVSQQVQNRFKDRFVNPNRNKPSAVGASSRATGDAGDRSFTMSDEEKKVMNTFIRNGVLTKDQYISELKRTRGV